MTTESYYLKEARRLLSKLDDKYFELQSTFTDMVDGVPSGPPAHTHVSTMREAQEHASCREKQIAELQVRIKELETSGKEEMDTIVVICQRAGINTAKSLPVPHRVSATDSEGRTHSWS